MFHVCYGILFGVDLEDKEELSSAKVPSVPQRKRKKRKKRHSPSADSGTADGNCEEGKAGTSGSNASSQEKVPENNKERKRKKLLVNEASETTNVATDTRENHSISVQNSLTDAEQSKKSQLKKMNPKVQNVPAKSVCQNGPATGSAAEDVSPSVTLLPPKAVKKKQKAGAVLVNGDPPVQQTDLKPSKEALLGTLPRKAGAESVPSRKVTLKTKTKLVGLEGMKVSSQNAATLKKKRKVNSVEANGVVETVYKKSRKVVCTSHSFLCLLRELPGSFSDLALAFRAWGCMGCMLMPSYIVTRKNTIPQKSTHCHSVTPSCTMTLNPVPATQLEEPI